MLVWQFFSYDSLSHWLSLLQQGPSLWLYFCLSSFSLIMSVPFCLSHSSHSPLSAFFQPIYPLLSSSLAFVLFLFSIRALLYATSSLSIHYTHTHFCHHFFFFLSHFKSHHLCLPPSIPLPPPPLPPTSTWRGVNMSSTCSLIVTSQQSKTTTLKLLNRLQQMTRASSFLLLFAKIFSCGPFGFRCITTMKQRLAGRINQEQDRERKDGTEKNKKARLKESKSEARIKSVVRKA